MAFILTKLFVTAGFIVLVTEIAKRSDKFGGMNSLTTLLVIFWMHFEGASDAKIGYLILPMFFAFSLISKFGFFASIVLDILHLRL